MNYDCVPPACLEESGGQCQHPNQCPKKYMQTSIKLLPGAAPHGYLLPFLHSDTSSTVDKAELTSSMPSSEARLPGLSWTQASGSLSAEPMPIHTGAHPIPAQYLVASWMALFSFPSQWGAQPQPPKPQADSTAGARSTLNISLTGLQQGEGTSQKNKRKEALSD